MTSQRKRPLEELAETERAKKRLLNDFEQLCLQESVITATDKTVDEHAAVSADVDVDVEMSSAVHTVYIDHISDDDDEEDDVTGMDDGSKVELTSTLKQYLYNQALCDYAARKLADQHEKEEKAITALVKYVPPLISSTPLEPVPETPMQEDESPTMDLE